MKKLITILALSVFLVGCTDGKGAKRTLENDGMTEVQITGYRAFKCDKNDSYSTGFKAKKNGRVVTGVVCSGVFKGYTIRYD